MQISSRFTAAVHILLVLNSKEKCSKTSDEIAESVNTNPVVIRRIEGMLKKSGLIDIQRGNIGASLIRSPKSITLLDIYQSVEQREDASLFRLHEDPNQDCDIGANIHNALASTLGSAQKALENVLASVTLDEVDQRILNELNQAIEK